jgi:intron-binding protein aquarius
LLRALFRALLRLQTPRAPRFLERFLELTIDLVSQLYTRRIVRPLLDDVHFELRCRFAPLLRYHTRRETSGARRLSGPGALASKLLDLLHRRIHFEVDDATGEAKTDAELLQEHYDAVQLLQRVAFKHFGDDLRELCLSNIGRLGDRATLLAHLERLSDVQITALVGHMRLTLGQQQSSGSSDAISSRRMALEVIVHHLAKPISRIEQVNALSLYPSERLIWDPELVPFNYRGGAVLALPKLNLQFLTLQDYLLRSFTLFRLESAYQIRTHLVGAIGRMAPRLAEGGGPSVAATRFGGWSRDAVAASNFEVTEVRRPDVGSLVPAVVRASITFSLSR